MADVTTSVRWFQRLRMRPARREPDFADLGTAFGLEMSLRPAESVAPSPPSPPGGPAWWPRRGSRPVRTGG